MCDRKIFECVKASVRKCEFEFNQFKRNRQRERESSRKESVGDRAGESGESV
jgi:hypothetical protein